MERRLLTRGPRLLLVSMFLNTVPLGFMNVVPLVYLAQIGYNPSIIGTIYAASAVANAVALVPMGFLADRYGRKWFLVAGSALPCASYAIFALTLNSGWLVLAGALGGIGFAGGLSYAIGNPAIIPLLARSVADEHRTTIFGLTQGVFTLGLSIGAVLSVVPSALGSVLHLSITSAHSYSYFLMCGLVVASVVPLLFFVEVRERPPKLDHPTGRGFLSRIPRLQVTSWSRIAKLCFVFVMSGLAVGIIIQLLPTWYALRFGVSEDAVGEWVALANAASIAIIPVVPLLVRKWGTLFSSVAAGFVSAGLLALMPLTGSFEGAATIFIARTFLEVMAWAMLLSYTMGVVPELERATATGITFTAWGVGAAVGTYAGGLFFSDGLLLAPFVLGVTSYAGASLVLLLFFRRSKLPEELPSVGLSREMSRALD